MYLIGELKDNNGVIFMFEGFDNSSILSSAIVTKNDFSDIKDRWNANRAKIKFAQNLIGLYGKATGDGRAIAVDKAIDVADLALTDNNDGDKSAVKSKDNISPDLKIEDTKFVGKGDGTGIEGANISLNAADSKDAISKAILVFSDRLKADGRDSGSSIFSSGCKLLDSGRYSVNLVAKDVKEPKGYSESYDLGIKRVARGRILDKSELTERNIFEESQIRENAIRNAPSILLPDMSADTQYIGRMKKGRENGGQYGDVEKNVTAFLVKRFGEEVATKVLEKNSKRFIKDKAGSFVHSIASTNEENIIKSPKVRTKVNVRSNNRGGYDGR